MGLTCETVCIQCKEAQRIPNFGFLYAGLAGIGLRTWPLDRYRGFLEEHRGHALDVFADGAPMFGQTKVDWASGAEPLWTEELRSLYPESP